MMESDVHVAEPVGGGDFDEVASDDHQRGWSRNGAGLGISFCGTHLCTRSAKHARPDSIHADRTALEESIMIGIGAGNITVWWKERRSEE